MASVALPLALALLMAELYHPNLLRSVHLGFRRISFVHQRLFVIRQPGLEPPPGADVGAEIWQLSTYA
jgi:hypothetical protein